MALESTSVQLTPSASLSEVIQKNVCAHEELEIVTVKEPCIEAYTKYVRIRKPGCNGKFGSCTVRVPKVVYYKSLKNVNRTRRHTTVDCCSGWIHVPGQEGCQRANCTPELCHNGGTCITVNNDSERRCQCPKGFQGSLCQYDVNECLVDNGGCHHDCVNTIGTYYCRCYPGFRLDYDNRKCVDINECEVENGKCSHYCRNTEGGFFCDCPAHLQLHSDGRRCVGEYLWQKFLSQFKF
uniref:EGF-like domain-containing protein n=1 Tax=Syphacia muris TaxID=451379 RepID=A0A0N5AA50_9BILA